MNQWHWEEKDCFLWCKDKFTSIFKDFELLNNDKTRISTKSINSFKGEAFLTNRKGFFEFLTTSKLRPFYDFDVELKWKGEIKGEKSEFVRY